MTSSEEIPVRIPPRNIEAEQALLGAILANNHALEKVSEFLKPIHFASPVHAAIYQAIIKLHSRGHTADPVTLKGYLANDGTLDEVGGVKYLMELASTATTIINVEDYGKLIFDRYLRRQLINIGTDIVNDAYAIGLDNDATLQMSQAEHKLYELGSEGQVEGGPKPFHESLGEVTQEIAEARKNPDGLSGVPTGFCDLDRKMSGLHKSDLIILAGRPGMGKTAFATCLAFNTARSFMNDVKDPRGVAFFSLEMSSSQLAGRILSMETQISSEKLRSGKITDDEFRRIVTFASELEKVPLYVDDTPGLTVAAIHNRCRRLKREPGKGLGLVVIDYLQLIDMSTSAYKGDMVRGLTETTRLLKIMAKDLNVPVLVLSQLNRGVEQRDDKRPLLSDLRDSGSIEQDADIVMFVFREHYYIKNSIPVQKQNETDDKFNDRMRKWEKSLIDLEKKAELIIAKQRHGSLGTINLSFEGQFTRFGDWNEPEQN
ncbi:MAG: replicative DNA helicase [Alphaproteobacteria bacterium]|nr:replicative DNA helicase [Alphaproteobacteria bacterium]